LNVFCIFPWDRCHCREDVSHKLAVPYGRSPALQPSVTRQVASIRARMPRPIWSAMRPDMTEGAFRNFGRTALQRVKTIYRLPHTEAAGVPCMKRLNAVLNRTRQTSCLGLWLQSGPSSSMRKTGVACTSPVGGGLKLC